MLITKLYFQRIYTFLIIEMSDFFRTADDREFTNTWIHENGRISKLQHVHKPYEKILQRFFDLI